MYQIYSWAFFIEPNMKGLLARTKRCCGPIAQVLFFRTTITLLRIAEVLHASPFITQIFFLNVHCRVKSNKINNIYCFIKDFLKWNWIQWLLIQFGALIRSEVPAVSATGVCTISADTSTVEKANKILLWKWFWPCLSSMNGSGRSLCVHGLHSIFCCYKYFR